MKHKITHPFVLAALLVVFALAVAVPTVQAAIPSATPVTSASLNPADRGAKLDSICQRINGRIDERINQQNDAKPNRLQAYDILNSHLQDVIKRLAADGYDVTKLKQEQVTLHNQITKFSTDYAMFIAKLQATKSFTCGHSQGQFLDQLQIARNDLKLVRQDADAIKAQYQNVIRPTIRSLRQSSKSPSPSAKVTPEGAK